MADGSLSRCYRNEHGYVRLDLGVMSCWPFESEKGRSEATWGDWDALNDLRRSKSFGNFDSVTFLSWILDLPNSRIQEACCHISSLDASDELDRQCLGQAN